VADVERVAIGADETAEEVAGKIARACVPLAARCLPLLAAGALPFAEQDESRATYCRRLEKADGALDFAAPAPVLAARINGLFPWPACTVEIAGQPIRLGLADALPAGTGEPAVPGTTLGTDREGLLVATGAGRLRLRRLQRPGGRMLRAAEFLAGFPAAAGALLPSRPMTDLLGRR
jgi:methionyl-tRNA formyltransferase